MLLAVGIAMVDENRLFLLICGNCDVAARLSKAAYRRNDTRCYIQWSMTTIMSNDTIVDKTYIVVVQDLGHDNIDIKDT